jgi:hypothetical protein
LFVILVLLSDIATLLPRRKYNHTGILIRLASCLVTGMAKKKKKKEILRAKSNGVVDIHRG